MITFNRILPIVRKEFRQVSRDKRSLGVLIFIPAFMLLMFGYAVNFDVRNIPLAFHDSDNSPESRSLVQSFLSSGYFELISHVEKISELTGFLDTETIRVGIVIPAGYANAIHAGQTPEIQVLIDGANASAASTVLGYINAVVQNESVGMAASILERSGRGEIAVPIDVRPRVWYNPDLLSARFLIPGLIAFILMVTCVVSTSLSVVREKERGTMEQIVVSPVKPVELIIGKTIPYIFTSLLSTLIILAVGYLLFGISVQGSYVLLFFIVLLFLFGALGWGLFISTIAETQQVAFLVSLTTTMLPTFLLSGFIFPIQNMPAAIQAVTYIVPAKYFLVALRGIMLKGTGLTAYWDQLVFLFIYAVILLIVSSVRLKPKGSR
jgi:ABC-2 type transport system permease protein